MVLKPIIERAFELAGSGECPGTSDVRNKLRAEGYTGVDEALFGPSLQSQLKALCAKTRRERIKTDEFEAAPRP